MPSHHVFLVLGSNINPVENFRACLKLLQENFDIWNLSPVYETPPVGFTEQAPFLNAAVEVITELDPASVKTILQSIENQLGRVRDPNNKNAPRTIDLDIALWDKAVFTYGEKNWQVPDPDILRFIHLARPLADLAPDYVYPDSTDTLAKIAEKLPIHGITRRDDVWADLPFLLRISVDFNALSLDGKMVRINTDIHQYLLNILHPGLRVILYASHDLEVEAMIHCEQDSQGQDWWYGIPDWDTMHDL
ncbi:MAG: 2-amino-4-hydroxy-6-hydroxymethyldihydropteridine diphosphokinase [Anaerolineae bacterium]|nr:MAG: 2-amino-4-hydroxy-6-hydroxymethyldihydropteridine diphosphokinase [Anaerolineae bacterium]